MKKQFLAKLLVLGMVLAMLPAAAFATANGVSGTSNNDYTYDDTNDTFFEDYNFSVPDVDDATDAEEPAETETPAEPTETETPAAEVTTNDAGQTVATAVVEVEVTGTTATVAVSAETVASLVSHLVESKADVLVLPVAAESATKAVVSVPAAALAEVAAQTNAAVTVESAVASVTISNEAIAAIVAGAEVVEISAEANADGTVTIALTADGVAVEDIPGGLDVAIPVTVNADNVAGVYLVKADGTEDELEWEIADGTLKVNITATGDIRVDEK